MAKLEIKLVKSRIGNKPNMNKTLTALGLKKTNDVAVHNDQPQIRGMIQVVKHLVTVEEKN
ncbi:MAG: 50S ribosomal protein L30 [Calditrichaeota bacterium]|nr:50S ribosomal protein L30 [Calditrichota bacterium]